VVGIREVIDDRPGERLSKRVTGGVGNDQWDLAAEMGVPVMAQGDRGLLIDVDMKAIEPCGSKELTVLNGGYDGLIDLIDSDQDGEMAHRYWSGHRHR
jgi:hypothetical protein